MDEKLALGAILQIKFHSLTILLIYEDINRDVLQDCDFSKISGLLQFLVRLCCRKLTKVQWNPVNKDTFGTEKSVLINGVSLLSEVSEKDLNTYFRP